MRLSPKLIEDVVTEVAGLDVVSLVKTLGKRKNVSEFKLAQELKKEINTVRNMLYKLYEANLVMFIRKKDKTKGWYIYYWTFNQKNIIHTHKNIYNKKLEKLNERLNREKSSQFYACPEGCLRLDFEQSISYNYKCPECGCLLQLEDNASKIKFIEKEISRLSSCKIATF
ncbi:hypothetical protein HYV79_02530 [Candidatus Woesearchaeota archaeon]|nr:hypothetical protein [Candidatus Woesearchaeota archaeon]